MSTFDWKTGAPSIFVEKGRSGNKFNGADEARSVAQVRLPPRPTYLVSDSVYLKQPKPLRRFPK